MIDFIFMNKKMGYGFCILIAISLCILNLIYIRYLKEKRWNYSDPVINTMLGTLYPLIVGVFLLWLLNGFEYLYLNDMYKNYYFKWMSRSVENGIFSIGDIKLMLYFLFIQFPLKAIHYILITFNTCLLYRILRILVQKKNYFFQDRNHEFRIKDVEKGGLKKVYHDVKTWKPVYKAMEKYRDEVLKYFMNKANDFQNILANELVYEEKEQTRKRKIEMYKQVINFYLSLSDLDILIHRFNTNIKTNCIHEMVNYTVKQIIAHEIIVNNNILKFAEMYKIVDEKEAEIMKSFYEEDSKLESDFNAQFED